MLALDTLEILLRRNSLVAHDRLAEQGGFHNCMKSHFTSWIRELNPSLTSARLTGVIFIGWYPGWSERLNRFTVYGGVNSYCGFATLGRRERAFKRMQERLVNADAAQDLFD